MRGPEPYFDAVKGLCTATHLGDLGIGLLAYKVVLAPSRTALRFHKSDLGETVSSCSPRLLAALL